MANIKDVSRLFGFVAIAGIFCAMVNDSIQLHKSKLNMKTYLIKRDNNQYDITKMGSEEGFILFQPGNKVRDPIASNLEFDAAIDKIDSLALFMQTKAGYFSLNKDSTEAYYTTLKSRGFLGPKQIQTDTIHIDTRLITGLGI
jgi:hypothetical protein